jgi:hypothetical protein
MNTQNRIKTVLTLAAVAILALAIGQVQAAAVTVPNGTFHVYKPGTNYTVLGTCPADIWVQQIGDNRPLSSSTPVPFDDSTSGTVIDCPGWITPLTLPEWRDGADHTTGTCDLFSLGYEPEDGSSVLNCFGAWSGQNGNLAKSAESLGNIAASSAYTLSAMYNGNTAPLTFELRAGGVTITPTTEVTPTWVDDNPATPDVIETHGTTGWEVVSRTYNPAAIAPYVGQPITIVLGTTPPHTTALDDPGRLGGQRGLFDNVTLDVVINDPDLPVVDAGIDMISWSGQAVQLDPNVVNNDTQVPQRPLSYAWSAEPPDGVEFSNPAASAPTVTITKATDNPSVVTLTLAVTLQSKNPVKDSMTIDVYDDACAAALDLGLTTIDTTDLDGNCITAFPDFAVMATTWLDDYTLTEPVAK